MVRNARLPDADEIMKLLNVGKTLKDVGEEYGVGPEAVRQRLKRAGITLDRIRFDHSHYIPWRVRSPHTESWVAKTLRIYSKRQQGAELSAAEQRTLEKFEHFMNGGNSHGIELSVHYDRNDPKGFWFEQRRPGDRDYICPPKR